MIQSPRQADETKGTFSPSPVKPNPISIQAVTITETNIETGNFGINTRYFFHATPLLDIMLRHERIDILPAYN